MNWKKIAILGAGFLAGVGWIYTQYQYAKFNKEAAAFERKLAQDKVSDKVFWERIADNFSNIDVPKVDLEDVKKQWAEGPGAALKESHARMMDQLNKNAEGLAKTIDNTRSTLNHEEKQ